MPTIDTIFEAAMALPFDQRVALSDRLLESMSTSRLSLSDELRAELGRRWEEHRANPDDVVPWEEVKAAALARMK
jgi:putative addiction module component (TIGR02574 family)